MRACVCVCACAHVYDWCIVWITISVFVMGHRALFSFLRTFCSSPAAFLWRGHQSWGYTSSTSRMSEGLELANQSPPWEWFGHWRIEGPVHQITTCEHYMGQKSLRALLPSNVERNQQRRKHGWDSERMLSSLQTMNAATAQSQCALTLSGHVTPHPQ